LGIIIKQSIKSTVYAYIGAVIGLVNFGILMPKLMSTEEIGLIRYILSIVLLLSQFSGLGLSNITNRLFPYFRNKEKNHNGFFTLGLIISGMGTLLSIILYFSLESTFSMGENQEIVFSDYVFYILPLSIITILWNYFDNFFRVLFNATIGVFLKELVARILFSVGIVLFYLELIDFDIFVFSYFLAYSLPTFILAILLLIKKEFVIQVPRPYLIKKLNYQILNIGAFGMLTGFSSIAILQFDSVMLKLWTDLSVVGVYTTMYFFAVMILLPSRSIKKIATIVVSESWKNNDKENILSIYFKSTITQLIIGAYLFLGIWTNIDNIIAVLGPEYEIGRYVVLLIGLTNVIDMFSGVNQAIISTSKKYKYASVFMIVMLALIVLTNWIFIPIYGITGAAIASLIAMFVTTLLRYLFVWKTFNLQPYNYKHLIVIAISFFTYFISYNLPVIANEYFDIILKGTVITILFSFMIYFSKVSEDINDKAEGLFKLLFKTKK